MTVLALQTHQLTRTFGSRIAVDELELSVPQGAIYGFLGPNGSGKTTTIRMILGLLRPDSGTVTVNGIDAQADRRSAAAQIGALLEAGSFYPNISGRQNLLLTARLLGHKDSEVTRVLRIVEMEEHAGRRVREYSLGMRQRLGIARALIGGPAMLVLDEPTNGLDPDGIIDMRRFLRRLPGETGATIFLSSHLLAEVEQIATHLGILSGGHMVAQGALADMQNSLPATCVIRTDDEPGAAHIIASHGFEVVSGQPNVFRMPPATGQSPERLLARLNADLVSQKVGVFAIGQQPASLEAFYRQRTGAYQQGE